MLKIVWAGNPPVPDVWKPLIPIGAVAYQEKVVPGTPEVNATGVVVPAEQMVWDIITLVTAGSGSTVTTRFEGVPRQKVGAGPVGVIT